MSEQVVLDKANYVYARQIIACEHEQYLQKFVKKLHAD